MLGPEKIINKLKYGRFPFNQRFGVKRIPGRRSLMGNSVKFTEEYFKMAQEDPELFLKISSDMVNSNENVLTDPMFRLCRGIAF